MNTCLCSCPNGHVLRTLSFSSRFSNLFTSSCIIFMTFLYLCNISSYFSSFISYFVYLGLLLFLFLMSLAKVYQFHLSFKKTSSWFHWCFLLVFISISSLILVFPLFCWLWALFVLVFLVLLGSRLSYLRIFLFLVEGLYCYKLSLNCFCCVPRILECWIFTFFCHEIFSDFLFDFFIDPLFFSRISLVSIYYFCPPHFSFSSWFLAL